MKKLITGGTGFIGAELARRLLSRGEEVVLFDIDPNYSKIKDIKNEIKVIQGNLSYASEVFNSVKENEIEGIYHLGSMLSIPSNINPWASFQINVCGTVNVLEAARLFNVNKVIFSSSTATYGPGNISIITDDTIQKPSSMYGCGKLYCELLGLFYKNRFGMDFRGLRYPSVIGPGVNTPGSAQYNAWMIEHAILGKPYECFVTENTKYPVMYYKDSVTALEQLYNAPLENIKTVNYNCAGVTPSQTAKELELIIRKYFPDFIVNYKPDPEIMKIHSARYFDNIDDGRAQEEWGWEPSYPNMEKVLQDFIGEMREK